MENPITRYVQYVICPGGDLRRLLQVPRLREEHQVHLYHPSHQITREAHYYPQGSLSGCLRYIVVQTPPPPFRKWNFPPISTLIFTSHAQICLWSPPPPLLHTCITFLLYIFLLFVPLPSFFFHVSPFLLHFKLCFAKWHNLLVDLSFFVITVRYILSSDVKCHLLKS